MDEIDEYEKFQKKRESKHALVGVLGIAFVCVSILLGFGEIVAPLIIIAYIVYMVANKNS